MGVAVFCASKGAIDCNRDAVVAIGAAVGVALAFARFAAGRIDWSREADEFEEARVDAFCET